MRDDLYAMAGTTNHLTRILEDMTNATERLGMLWKEKGLTVVAGPFTEYKAGDVVEIVDSCSFSHDPSSGNRRDQRQEGQ